MAKLDPAEANRRRLKVNSTNFDFKFLDPADMRKILRASLALCEIVEMQGEPNVQADKLYVTQTLNGSFAYEYHYTHLGVSITDKYSQSTLDRLARKYNLA